MLQTKVSVIPINYANNVVFEKTKKTSSTPFFGKQAKHQKKLGADSLMHANMDLLCFYAERQIVLWIIKENPKAITRRGAAAYLSEEGALNASLFSSRSGKPLSRRSSQFYMDAFCAMVRQFTKHYRFDEIVKNIISNKKGILQNFDIKKQDFNQISKFLLYQHLNINQN